MSLSHDEVRHVARLARLDLTDDEVERLSGELSAILAYAEQVGEAAADDVAPMTHPYPLRNVFRADTAGEPLDRDELLAAAPRREQDRFAVPRIVAEEG